jgi:Ca2+-binding EF-hand superfamily protein
MAKTVDIDEFLSDEMLKQVFNYFDHIGSGSISKEDLKKAFLREDMKIETKDINQIFELYDKDKKGELDFEDFKFMF